jgi:hypothetical protein
MDVDGWCTKCKLMLAHTIEAIAGGKITRVHCNTCRSQHAYRSRPPGTAAAGGATSGAARAAAHGPTRSGTARRATRTTRAGKAAPQAGDYPALMHGRDPSQARPYRLSEHFAAKDLIAHPTFGLGLVLSSKDGSKIEVLFPDGPKTLAQGR